MLDKTENLKSKFNNLYKTFPFKDTLLFSIIREIKRETSKLFIYK